MNTVERMNTTFVACQLVRLLDWKLEEMFDDESIEKNEYELGRKKCREPVRILNPLNSYLDNYSFFRTILDMRSWTN